MGLIDFLLDQKRSFELKPRPEDEQDKPNLPPEVTSISKELSEYLNHRISKTESVDLSISIQCFTEKVQKMARIVSIEDISDIVQNFYRTQRKRLEAHSNISTLSEDEQHHICELTERYIMICCYSPLFCPFTSDDEEQDLNIQGRIKSLKWITPQHLSCPFKDTDPGVKGLFFLAIKEILEVDGFKAPHDKLASIMRCSQKIFTILQAGDGYAVSADEFLTSLIFILLKANPPRIISNVNYISRFRNEVLSRSGEEGYYFTSLCCALSFIQNLTAASLNLPQLEFDSYMSGEEVPPGSWKGSLLVCEGVQTMNHNLKTLANLTLQHNKLTADYNTLEKDMLEFQTSVADEVETIMDTIPFNIREQRHCVALHTDQIHMLEQSFSFEIPEMINLESSSILC